MPRYTDVRVVAHVPNTGVGGGHDDVKKNVLAVTAAITAATTKLKEYDKLDFEVLPSMTDTVLKIFVAPEWTWRKKDGIYVQKDVDEIDDVLLHASKTHADVVFFPGTILWWIPEKTHVFETAFVYFGGVRVHVQNKRFIYEGSDSKKDLDFSKATPDDFWKNWKGSHDEVDSDLKKVSFVEAGVFDIREKSVMRGLPGKKDLMMVFGLEIGRDATKNYPLKKSGRLVDIQVMLSGSGGAAISNDSLSVATGGVAIHCDGVGEWKKTGLHGFTVEKPVVIPKPDEKGRSFQDGGRIVSYDRLFPLVVRRLKPAASERSSEDARIKEYLDYRAKVAKASSGDLVQIFKENETLRGDWAKKHTAYWRPLAYEWLLNQTWEEDALKETDFPGSEMGVGLGFYIGVNKHLDMMYTALGKLDDELFLLGNYLCDKTRNPGLCWIQGPLKKKGDAFAKTVFRDYQGNSVKNKDLVRGTVVVASGDPNKNQVLLKQVGEELEKLCKGPYGIQSIKGGESDPAKSSCGYSGWNFALLFHGHPKVAYKDADELQSLWVEREADNSAGPVPAEVQMNTAEMMFSKHSMALLVDMKVFETPAAYLEHEKKVGFQGGLGHTLYEINRTDEKESKDGPAAILAREYHDCARTVPFRKDQAQLDTLKDDLQKFGASLKPGSKAKENWEKHFDDKWVEKNTLSSGAKSRTKKW